MPNDRSTSWRYGVCGLLLLATMLLYMDRQTLSQLATTICTEYSLSNEQYGWLDTGFSLAFAFGASFFGVLVDRISPRWLYPGVVIGWSCAGFATAYADSIGTVLAPVYEQTLGHWFFHDVHVPRAYLGFMMCRIALGFFESGHWPCALVTTQVILSRSDRSLGNSILQSGAAIGAIVTPLIVLAMLTDRPGGWQPPFRVIGCIGFLWCIPWLLMINGRDLDRTTPVENAAPAQDAGPEPSRGDVLRMFAVLVVVVICINLTWQYFRVWLPKYLEETHDYTKTQVGWFTSAYYVSTDVGCITVGLLVKWLISSGWDIHRARLCTFTFCAALTLLAIAVAFMPGVQADIHGFTSPASMLLLVTLLLIGAGTLGLYPNYYAFAQELSKKHQGKISGTLGTIAWIGSAIMQALVGRSIDATKSYATGIILAGLAPLVACAALWFFWQRGSTATVTAYDGNEEASPAIPSGSAQIEKH
jgi:ACS family hexuronate transporter-like MFS transporter